MSPLHQVAQDIFILYHQKIEKDALPAILLGEDNLPIAKGRALPASAEIVRESSQISMFWIVPDVLGDAPLENGTALQMEGRIQPVKVVQVHRTSRPHYLLFEFQPQRTIIL